MILYKYMSVCVLHNFTMSYEVSVVVKIHIVVFWVMTPCSVTH
jgi:hypothetical protein